MTTYTGRKREPNTVVFGNQQVIDLAATASINFAADVLKGTFKPVPNAPATEPKEVSSTASSSSRQQQQDVVVVVVLHKQDH